MQFQKNHYLLAFVVLCVLGFGVLLMPLRHFDPPYNRIDFMVGQGNSDTGSPINELTVKRVDGNTITQRAHLAAGCYAISGKDFSECDGQMYAVQRDGSIVKSGTQYSNDPFVSPTGSYTLKFAYESTLKPKEEPYPGSWKTNLTIVNHEGKTLQSFDTKRYGVQFLDVIPLAFSQDEQYIFLQVWAFRGGDFIDQMFIIKQAVQDKSFEVLVRNPNPPEAISDSTVKNFTLSLFLGLSMDKQGMFIEEMKPIDGDYHPQLFYVYDFRTGKRTREIALNVKGGFTLLFSPNQQYFTQQVENRVAITKISSGAVTSVKPLIPDGCNLNDLSNDGNKIAITCDQKDQTEAWVYAVRSEKRKLISSWPTSASGYKFGETYNIFAGFAL